MTRVRFKVDMDAALSATNAAKIIRILERFVTEVGQIMPMPAINISIEADADVTEAADE